jgi:L-lactate dehydrogenase complex protein LldG
VSDARAEILARVREAIDGDPPLNPTIPRDYRRADDRTRTELVELFCERVADYHAEVHRVGSDAVATAVFDACSHHRAGRLVIPLGLPDAWRPSEVELIDDHGLSPQALDQLDGVITGSTVAIAETGTIALTAGEREGRRALTLVPDLHICVVEQDQIVGIVPDALAVLGPLVTRQRRPITLVSGPSATSDIELSRVEGVHGPRQLVVLVVADPEESQ